MAIVKAVLFRELKFQATRDNFMRLKETNVASFTPFVEELNVLPSLYSPTLSYPDFEKVQLNIADHRQSLENSKGDAVPEFELLREYLLDNSPARVPVMNGEDEMKDAYETYKECAQMDLELMLNGSFRDIWMECLQSFQRLTAIHLNSLLSEHPFIPTLDCFPIFSGVDECGCDECWQILTQDCVSGGDFVSSTVVPCMGMANTTLEVLTVDSAMLVTLGGHWRERGCQLPSFDGLAKLRIYSPSNHIHWEVNDDFDNRLKWRIGVETLLDKTHTTLQDLDVSDAQEYPELPWVSMSRLSFPCLRRLKVHGLYIDLESLAADIPQLPELEELAIANAEIFARCERDWKPVFDALRDHQPRMKHISLSGIQRMDDTGCWGIIIIADELRGDYPGEESCSFPESMGNSLQRYLTERGEWDGPLEEWFTEDPA
ncbi:hypothetical protein CLCR_03538 [Cladophialophora carrionii]|uniref:F-box domain protein n=1 Tax=Cladophialophora carrionii TaxID=86049 RepID=A0A1C1CG89_9EURO|nr:hypothetical protein CLCR_03538 [Cladophialophora carrionii]